jgi:hypothetical protein
VQGGWWEKAAGYTPAAMVAQFQHGLVRLDTALVALTLAAAGLALAAVWMRLGMSVGRRAIESLAVCAVSAALVWVCTLTPASWDVSESRGNSFSLADERALRSIRAPLTVEVHLAPEDPRRDDLERKALSKLRRVLPRMRVRYISATSIGLFEQTSAGYGEVWYDLGGKQIMSRATTPEGVLDAVYSLAGVTPPREDEADVFRGRPLAVQPRAAGWLFFGVWPGLVLISGVLVRRRFL